MRPNPKPFNPRLQKHRIRGCDFWGRIRREWRKLPAADQTLERYVQIFTYQAGLKK